MATYLVTDPQEVQPTIIEHNWRQPEVWRSFDTTPLQFIEHLKQIFNTIWVETGIFREPKEPRQYSGTNTITVAWNGIKIYFKLP